MRRDRKLREICEFRISESLASRLSQPNVGRLLASGNVRQIKVEVGDPLFHEIRLLDSKLRESEGRRVFTFSLITRVYTPTEIESAELLQMFITTVFEPAGEECGTQYDETSACGFCGAGARQVSDLFLDHRKLPRKREIASTIVGEVVVSERLAKILKQGRSAGLILGLSDIGANIRTIQLTFKSQRLEEGYWMLPDARAYRLSLRSTTCG